MTEHYKTWDFQSEAIQKVSEYLQQGEPQVGLYLCTGAGKSSVSVLSALYSGFDHITVMTPSTSISSGFERMSGDTWTLDGLDCPDITIPKIHKLDAKSSSVDSVRTRLSRHLGTTRPNELVVAHYSTLGDVLDSNPDLTGKILIPDESHHTDEVDDPVGSTWSHPIKKWVELGGIVLHTSATPRRFNIPCVEWTLLDMMIAGLAPQNILAGTVVVNSDNWPYIAQRVRRRWEEDGRPATYIRVPSSLDEKVNKKAVEALVEAFRDSGVEVIDTTYKEGGVALEKALNTSKEETDYLKLPRVFIAIQRMGEGTDVPWLHNFYCIGIPKSVVAMDQGIGRLTRTKYKEGSPRYQNYPEEWLNKIQAVFFTRPIDNISESKIWLAYSQRLTSYQMAGRILQATTPPGESPKRKDAKSSRRLATALDLFSKSYNHVELKVRPFLPADQPELSADAIARLVVQYYKDTYEGDSESCRHCRNWVLGQLKVEGAPPAEAGFSKWVGHLYPDDLVQKFRQDTLVCGTSFHDCRAVHHHLDSITMSRYSAPEEETSLEAIRKRIADFREEHRRFPKDSDLRLDYGALKHYHKTTLADFTIQEFGMKSWYVAVKFVLEGGRSQGQSLPRMAALRQDVPEVVYYPKALDTVDLALEMGVLEEVQKLTLAEADRLGRVKAAFKGYLSRAEGDYIPDLKAKLQESLESTAPQQRLKSLLEGNYADTPH